ncbi:sensor histidine kinase [Microbacterium sp. YY-01]|uniref:sensor histidine kinase n=1 Tax=Microbacterium sp. YY-01 TaxID=3421634 RepID=UPI003D17B1C4
MTAPAGKRPLRLQTRLMAAVIGFVSLILVFVSIVISLFLGGAMERQLDDRLAASLRITLQWTLASPLGAPAEAILDGKDVNPGLLLIVADGETPATGAIVKDAGGGTGEILSLSNAQLQSVSEALLREQVISMTIPGHGSYRIEAAHADGTTIVVGLPRRDIQRTMTELFTIIALATVGGLLMLALTTAITIQVALRPLRAVAATATRVSSQPLDRGDVTITERVPESEADPSTETGLVGAALNVLLDHVDSSLAARQRNEERMRQFIADASHELRTPLTSIRGYSELSLRSTDLSDNTRMSLERIQAQSLRMTGLVEDLLLLARLDEGRELAESPVDLCRLAVEAVDDARPTGTDHEWRLEVPSEPVEVTGDSARLAQVVTNLVANARTHTPAGTTIVVEVGTEPAADEHASPHAFLRVTDNGPGIAPEVRDTLFSRFARADRSRARHTGGTGLGLAISQAIVTGHGGTIEVESAPGKTMFTVRLPLR